MLSRTVRIVLAILPAAALVSFLICATAAQAGDLRVLHSFGVGYERGGSDLYAGLVFDPSGNLYGAAESGGAHGYGTVYKLSPGPKGAWVITVLWNFKGGPGDGATPHATLVRDSSGNLYGTTAGGGLNSKSCNGGCGTVFELSQVSGSWRETVLHSFTGGSDGAIPYAGVILDPAGTLYGATMGGGAFNDGTVYSVAPLGGGAWQQTVLHSFTGNPDGAGGYSAPTLDALGNLYGATYSGGARDKGTVYELTPSGGGVWNERILHSFTGGSDGVNPGASLIFDAEGDLYGTTVLGGSANCGIAFRLTPDGLGGWTETILHTFLGYPALDGENPNELTWGGGGILYGTTVGGGNDNPGTIFQMTPQGDGYWTETLLYNFTAGETGAYPSVGLTIDRSGNLYGTTLWGGPAGDTTGGVAFKFTP